MKTTLSRKYANNFFGIFLPSSQVELVDPHKHVSMFYFVPQDTLLIDDYNIEIDIMQKLFKNLFHCL